MTWKILEGDCVETMRAMPEASVDAIVTDPPYGLSAEPDAAEVLRHWLAGDDYEHRGGGFMGKSWDSFVPGPVVWREAFRVLKPGGHLLAFFGTRTYDLGTIAIRLGGFEIRDEIAWLYGSGFPKSLDVSKAIDKAAGAAREVVGVERRATGSSTYDKRPSRPDGLYASDEFERTAPATPDAERWQGWGTALKPAFEPIVMARKPLAGTVAGNVLEHGTGAINVDGCRIGTGGQLKWSRPRDMGYHGGADSDGEATENALGRWPANVALDEEAAAMLDQQTADLKEGFSVNRNTRDVGYGDSGGASRFLYVAKASSSERNAGLNGFADHRVHRYGAKGQGPLPQQTPAEGTVERNVHPTVKPIDLMRWLVRLVTPPGGTILDPFTGSGTTGCAAVLEGFDFVGCEREAEYRAIAEARIRWWSQFDATVDTAKAVGAGSTRQKATDAGQLDLLGEAA